MAGDPLPFCMPCGRYQEEFAIRNPIASWSRRLALPLLLGLGLAGLWSAYWMYVQARIQDDVDREVAHLQANGGDFACENRQWQGFPFSITVTCGRATLTLPGGTMIDTARLEASGHLHNLRYIVTMADGPTRIRLDTGESLTVDHTPARIGFTMVDDGLARASLAAEQIAVEGKPRWLFRGRSIAVAAGGGGDGSGDTAPLQFSASGEALTLVVESNPPVALEALELQGRVEAPPATLASDLKTILNEAARLRSRVTVATFNARMGNVDIAASGTVELGPEGPTGTLVTTVSNYREFLADLEGRGVVSRRAVRASSVVIGLLQGGGRRADGEVEVALRFHEGQVFWGPFVVAEIPPLQ